MGNCCNHTNKSEESRFSISLERPRSSVNLQSLPIVNTESSSDSSLFARIDEIIENENHSLKNDSCTKHQEETPFITANSLDQAEFKCPCGGFFIWQTDIVFWHYEKYANWNIHCDFCNTYFSKSAWKCNTCEKVLCRNCGNSKGMHPLIEYCTNQHELIWTPNISAYCSEEYKKTTYICEICKRNRNEPSWSCRDCEYNICIHCGIVKCLVPPLNPLICEEKNQLVFNRKSNNSSLCSKCHESSGRNSYCCNSCNYSLCTGCSEPIIRSMIAHPGLRCKRNHNLIVTKIDEVKAKSGKWIICMKCDNINMKYAYLCLFCCECYCLNCGDDIIKMILNYTGAKCSKGHCLFWSPLSESNDSENICSVCWKRSYSGCFRCEICRINVCEDDVARNN